MAAFSNYPRINLWADDRLSRIRPNDAIEKKILHEIIGVLSLDDDEQKEKIMHDLLENGRQALVKYESDIISKVYKEAMSGNDSALMILLKKFFEHKLKIKYCAPAPWFVSFLEDCKRKENHDIYDRVFTRMADYGLKYMKNCPLLSVILQLIFDGIDDECLKEGKAFDQLWFTIANEGIKSITKFSEYIAQGMINKQLKKQSTLFQAVREYYRENVLVILIQSNIRDREYIYTLALDDIVEDGWSTDFKSIKDNLTPNSYKLLLERTESFHQSKLKRINMSYAKGSH